MRAESTLVLPYASIERGEPKDVAGKRVLLEAKLVWSGDVLAVTYLRPRDVVRVRDLELDVPGGGETIVARDASLVLPNGTRVPDGCTMTLRLGRAKLRLSFVADDGEAMPRARSDGRVRRAVLGAAVLHLAVLACLVHGRASDVTMEENARQYIGAAMAAAESRAQAEVAAAMPPEEALFETPGTAGATTSRDEGSAGNPSHTNEGARRRVASGDGRRPRAPTEDAIGEFGMISLVAGEGGEKPGTSPWARERGTSARGNLFGETIDDAAGVAGLGLSSAGSGAGERGEAIALGAIGTVGQGGGRVRGVADRPARLDAGHVVRSPSVGCRCGETFVNGRLPPESIQRIVRESFGRFRACYEQGLQHDATLEGRISVKFVIDRSGAVSTAYSSESSISDPAVDRCVVGAFLSLAFPQPEGGIVTVVYPLVFTNA